MICSTDEFSARFPGLHFQDDAPFGEITTFRTGGNAARMVFPRSAEELKDVLSFLRGKGEEYFILGRGSNILVSDGGYGGTVIRMDEGFHEIREGADGRTLTAEAGVMMPQFSRYALSKGLAGLEFMAGIPGTVGGGLRMNAGAYGSEIRDVVRSARLLLPDGTEQVYTRDSLELSYRHSVIPALGAVVLEAAFELSPEDPELIRSRMEELQERRREKQPLNLGSAGSTFKRPEGCFAGKLIDDAGLRGFRIGGAAVSEKHAGFVVNLGDASASDVYRVIRSVQEAVLEKHGVALEREVILLGDFE